MTRLEQAEKLLSDMTPAEKALVLQWEVRDLGDAFVISPKAIPAGGARAF